MANLKEVIGELRTLMKKEFIESNRTTKDDINIFGTFAEILNCTEDLYDDVESLKKEIEELKKKA